MEKGKLLRLYLALGFVTVISNIIDPLTSQVKSLVAVLSNFLISRPLTRLVKTIWEKGQFELVLRILPIISIWQYRTLPYCSGKALLQSSTELIPYGR